MSEVRVPVEAIKGRGAASRLPHRFEKQERLHVDDGWGTLADGLAQAAPTPTEVIWEDAKSIISSNDCLLYTSPSPRDS